MYIKIRDIKVINANLLACPYTAGFSLASFKGLMDAISFKMTNNENINDNIIFKGFGVIISSVNSKINEKDLENYSKKMKFQKKVIFLFIVRQKTLFIQVMVSYWTT